MNQEDIICMARDSGIELYGMGKNREQFLFYVERFAALVRADEREACAQIAKDWDASHPETNYGACIASIIRARGRNDESME